METLDAPNAQPPEKPREFPFVRWIMAIFIVWVIILCAAGFILARKYAPSIRRAVASFYINQAETYYRQKEYQAAISAATQAVQWSPDYIQAYLTRGNIYGSQADYARSKADFEKAIQLDPSQPMAYNNLCWFGSLLGDVANVAADCDKALELAPGNPYFTDSRGLARALQGDYPGAINDFQFFVDSAGQYPDITRAEVIEREHWILNLKAGINPFDQTEIQIILSN